MKTIEQAAQECGHEIQSAHHYANDNHEPPPTFQQVESIIASAMREVVERELTAAKAEIAVAAEKLAYVHGMGLRFGMMKTADKPEPYLAHMWDKDSDHERMFREWSDSIGIKAERDQLHARVEEMKRLLGEVYRNTNLRHHPELAGLADIVSKQLST